MVEVSIFTFNLFLWFNEELPPSVLRQILESVFSQDNYKVFLKIIFYLNLENKTNIS